jgi:oligopeptide transport system permease protein
MGIINQVAPKESRLPGIVTTPRPEAPQSRLRETLRKLLAHRMAVAGLVFIALLALWLVFGPLLWRVSPVDQNLAYGCQPPSCGHPFGTDDSGRDIFARAMQGGRISLMLGVLATLVSLFIGVSCGAVSAYTGGRTDALMMRIVDILYALPFTLFVILLMTVMPSHSWVDDSAFMQACGLTTDIFIMFVAIGSVEWLTMARIVRGQVLAVKKREYVVAARCLGYGPGYIIRRHIVPNVLGPVIVYATLTIPAVILLESFISFLGLGVRPPSASWGTLIRDGAAGMGMHPWTLIIPAALFSLTLLSFNFLGDGLRDALDPRSGDK